MYGCHEPHFCLADLNGSFDANKHCFYLFAIFISFKLNAVVNETYVHMVRIEVFVAINSVIILHLFIDDVSRKPPFWSFAIPLRTMKYITVLTTSNRLAMTKMLSF